MENKFMIEGQLEEVAKKMIASLEEASASNGVDLCSEITFSSKKDIIEYAKTFYFINKDLPDSQDFFFEANKFALNFGDDKSMEYRYILNKCVDTASELLLGKQKNKKYPKIVNKK